MNEELSKNAFFLKSSLLGSLKCNERQKFWIEKFREFFLHLIIYCVLNHGVLKVLFRGNWIYLLLFTNQAFHIFGLIEITDGFKLEPIITIAPTAPKDDARFKNGQN